MSRPIIQSLWIGNKLSVLEQLSISSFILNGHEFHLYSYNNITNLPNGAQLKDANEIIPEKFVFTYCSNSYAGFADWFRWALLYKKGNLWVDTDVVCLKPFEFDTSIIFGLEGASRVGCAVLGFPANYELCSFLENCCNKPNVFLPYDSLKIKKKKLKRRILNRARNNIRWGEAGGPDGFTKALKHFDLMSLAKPFTYFYPIHCESWGAVFNETLAEDIGLFSQTYSIHLWNEKTREFKGFDKNASFPKKSLFEQLKSKYL